jgi:hypothetical protein
MIDMRGIAFIGFTGIGALAGVLLAPILGGVVALFGGSFWLTSALVMAFMTGTGAAAGCWRR